MPDPRPLINADGGSFAEEIAEIEPLLAALANPDRIAYRNANAGAIATHSASHLLIVAGPGSGKSFLFLERIQHWLPRHPEAAIYVSSFVRKLVKDLQADIDTKLSSQDRARITVTTLHALARSLLERSHGAPGHPREPHIQVISSGWAPMVWDDVLEFHPDKVRSNKSLRGLEKQFHVETFETGGSWPQIIDTYYELVTFYNAVGFADMIVLAREAVEADPTLNEHLLWIIDEFQDFNPAEEHLIRSVTEAAQGVLIAGDDEQALYQQLKASHPDIIVSYYAKPSFANAMLPFCSRCSYFVCHAASAFIANARDAAAIAKIYLPLQESTTDPKVRVIAAAAPTSAVDYIERFVSDHREDLEAHRGLMEAGDETDPFLLILTPERTARFYSLGGAQDRLQALVAEWGAINRGHSNDYWKLVQYCTASWEPRDNFAVRKVLEHEGVPSATVHDLLVEALDRGCRLSEVHATVVEDALLKCGEVRTAIERADLDYVATVAQTAQLLPFSDESRLAAELEADPISMGGSGADDESEEAIETAGAAAPVEMMTMVGSKGLSAHHVVLIGCDDVNLARTSRLAFFVALTRARRSLHLITAVKAGGAHSAHPFVLELPEDCCEYRVHRKTAGAIKLTGRQSFERRLGQWTSFQGRR